MKLRWRPFFWPHLISICVSCNSLSSIQPPDKAVQPPHPQIAHNDVYKSEQTTTLSLSDRQWHRPEQQCSRRRHYCTTTTTRSRPDLLCAWRDRASGGLARAARRRRTSLGRGRPRAKSGAGWRPRSSTRLTLTGPGLPPPPPRMWARSGGTPMRTRMERTSRRRQTRSTSR